MTSDRQALFDKLIVLGDDTVGIPFKGFFTPDVQELVVRQQGRTAGSGSRTGVMSLV